MLISTKGRYALRVIARRQEISEKYLENIIKLLVRAKLLNGLRGKGGGYQLTKAPEQYTVGAILRLTEDSLAPVSCMEADAAVCPRAAKCRTLPIWQGLAQVINDYLDHITLADLMNPIPRRAVHRLVLRSFLEYVSNCMFSLCRESVQPLVEYTPEAYRNVASVGAVDHNTLHTLPVPPAAAGTPGCAISETADGRARTAPRSAGPSSWRPSPAPASPSTTASSTAMPSRLQRTGRGASAGSRPGAGAKLGYALGMVIFFCLPPLTE